MDCGPATLKCLLEGFGISVSYGRLREACQTDVDGTSIDTLEEIAGQLGLEAEQTVLPLDHLLLQESQALPALVVVRLPNGLTHFVVLWRRHGSIVQLMDPANGRRWAAAKTFLSEVYVHEIPIAAAYWRQWAQREEFQGALRRRMADLGLEGGTISQLLAQAQADSTWRTFAALDASTRMVGALVAAEALDRGGEAARGLQVLFTQAAAPGTDGHTIVPAAYWSARSAPPDANGEEQVLLRGAVLVRVLGRKPARREPEAAGRVETAPGNSAELSAELVAALQEKAPHPGRELWKLLQQDGWMAPGALMGVLVLASGAVVLEAILFRGLFDLGRELTVSGQRLAAMTGILGVVGLLLLLELPLQGGLLRLGRRLEIRLRVAFLEKIPRLVDRYFQSRLMSDMAERSHMVQTLRGLPEVGGRFLRGCCELMFTAAGIAWLDPASTPMVIGAVLSALGLPLLTNALLTERDLRLRTHEGALARWYLDALLGLIPIRAHGAERAVRSEHESLLVEWSRAGFGLQRTAVLVEGLQAFLGVAFAAWLLLAYLSRNADAPSVLLLVYWGLNLPVLAEEIALLARQYPSLRNVTLRLLEPLGAPELEGVDPEIHPPAGTPPPGGLPQLQNAESEIRKGPVENKSHPQNRDRGEEAQTNPGASEVNSAPASIFLSQVSVRAGGHSILEEVSLRIAPGEHVAMVGPSGAGKSSLVGLLLGWHRPASGEVQVDGLPLDTARLERLRRATAWVDPAVQLWNRSLLENLCYGTDDEAGGRISWVVHQADLVGVLQKLPDGLQTRLGEGGGLVSGGEGQRVRFGRGLLRGGTRLVILDEAFRGLDRAQRRSLLERARAHWRGVTLLCITHDVGETRAFDRVLVIENGRLVEDGAPAELAQNAHSRYAALIEAETEVREKLWAGDGWRRQRLEGGQLVEDSGRKELAP